MSFFGTSRRITEQTVQRKLFSPPPRTDYGILKKEDRLLEKEAPEINRLNEPRRNTYQQLSSTSKGFSSPKPKISDLVTHKASNKQLISGKQQVIHHKLFDVPKVKQRHVFFEPYLNVKWFSKTRDEKGGPVRRSGGRFGKLGAANEAGFFHKSDRERLMELKKTLKDKGQGPDVPKTI